MAFIGYVSMPFRRKHGVDFDELWERAIYTAPTAALLKRSSDLLLFREDSSTHPELEERHQRRLERFGRPSSETETRLREEIQRHIILSDFVIADISHGNPNVMLEVGFAQATGKRIIYITHTYKKNPNNLGDLKRFFTYQLSAPDQLRYNLSVLIKQVVEEVTAEELAEKETGGEIQYFEERQKIPLDEKFAAAQDTIQILTTNLTTVSANYVDHIGAAINRAKKSRRRLEVTILTSDPTNPYIHPRADQLNENREGYRYELEGSLTSIAAKLEAEPNCEILTYQDFPVQLWHRIDATIYIGSSSLIRRTRYNSVFAISVDVPGIKETYLDHFDELKKRATPYSPKRRRLTMTPKPRPKQQRGRAAQARRSAGTKRPKRSQGPRKKHR